MLPPVTKPSDLRNQRRYHEIQMRHLFTWLLDKEAIEATNFMNLFKTIIVVICLSASFTAQAIQFTVIRNGCLYEVSFEDSESEREAVAEELKTFLGTQQGYQIRSFIVSETVASHQTVIRFILGLEETLSEFEMTLFRVDIEEHLDRKFPDAADKGKEEVHEGWLSYAGSLVAQTASMLTALPVQIASESVFFVPRVAPVLNVGMEEVPMGTPVERVQMVEVVHETCVVCTEQVAKLITLGCKNHKYCEDCQRAYLQDQVQKRHTTVKCMDGDCKTLLSMEQIQALLSAAEQKKLSKAIHSELRRENLISSGQSRFFLCGQLLWGSVRFMIGGGFCPQGGQCCLSQCLPPVNIEHCPSCATIIENGNACPHMDCSECGREYMRGQQCNIPCYCCTAGCYCPIPAYVTCGINMCCLGYGCCASVPSFWIKRL